MHRRVVLTDTYGDTHNGIEHQTVSDQPNTITVGSCRWFTDVWADRGWTVTWEGEWSW